MTSEFQGPLAVDLDGTLIRSDMLFESFWTALSQNWRSAFGTLGALAQGRAALKRYLAERVTLDPASLPYDEEVLAYVAQWRAAGGRTALVTATDSALAEAIAAHLGLFDEVHGSDGETNLKGAQKAAFLEDHFGLRGFAYMGDAPADIPVWEKAGHGVTVHAPAALRKQAEAALPSVEHLGQPERDWGGYLKALRPHQWLKNLLVFLPLLASHQFDGATLLAGLLAFLCFNMVASSVYVMNDLLDLPADRAHPRKRTRPFASGRVPLAHGTALGPGLFLLGLALGAALGLQFLLVMLLYFGLTTAYSLGLKRRMILDIFVLAGLYTVRLVAGSLGTGIPLSVWLFAFSVFFFLALAAVKRQTELVDSAKRGKLEAQGRGYHVEDLPIISMVALSAGYVSVLVMALYINAPGVMELYARPEILWGVCATLLYWLTRTVLISHRGQMHDDPVVYAAKDRGSQLCFVIILAFTVGAMVP